MNTSIQTVDNHFMKLIFQRTDESDFGNRSENQENRDVDVDFGKIKSNNQISASKT